MKVEEDQNSNLDLPSLSSARDRSLVGGKAIGLAKLASLPGVKIPPGFVVPWKVIPALLTFKTAILHQFDCLRAEYVAVRSSGVQEDNTDFSMAGVLNTKLYIDRNNLLDAIRTCSMANGKAKAYIEGHQKFRDSAHSQLKISIVVQAMLDVETAGVAFSKNPISMSDEIIVEAVRGLGIALADGEVTPDRYTEINGDLKITVSEQTHKRQYDPTINETILTPVREENRNIQKLNTDLLKKLIKKVKEIERYCGYPVDIEWAVDKNGVLYFLQVRPITTSLKNNDDETHNYQFVWADTHTLWQHDLSISAYSTGVIWASTQEMLYIRSGKRTTAYISRKSLSECYNLLHIFLDKKQMNRTFLKIEELRKNAEGLFKELFSFGVDWQNTESTFLAEKWDQICDIVRQSIAYFRMSTDMHTHSLIDHLREKVSRSDDFYDILNTPLFDEVDQELLAWCRIQDRFNDVEPDDSILWDHLYTHPWLAVNQHDSTKIIRQFRKKFRDQKQSGCLTSRCSRLIRSKKEASETQVRLFKSYNDDEFRYLVRTIHRVAKSRMDLKWIWAGVDLASLQLFKEMCKRSGEQLENLSHFYLVSEIAHLARDNKSLEKKVITERKTFGYAWELVDGVIHRFSGEDVKDASLKVNTAPLSNNEKRQDAYLYGNVAFPGTVEGTVRIFHCNDVEGRCSEPIFHKGDIIVSEMTQPTLLDVLIECGGIITDEGGLLSHAAIIAREFQKPCIVGTKKATEVLKDGMRVQLTGTGKIYILDSENQD